MQDSISDTSAVFSYCHRYRYRLYRVFGKGRQVTFIGLNPSTAGAVDDDPTIRRCLAYATAWGAGTLVMVNLYAYRATDPRLLRNARKANVDIVGSDNREHVARVLAASDITIAAWGCNGCGSEEEDLVLSRYAATLYALGLNKDGSPVHPLYQRKEARPVLLERLRRKDRGRL